MDLGVDPHTTKGVLGGTLKKNCLTIQDGESFFEASNFGLATLDALSVGFGLGNAALLDALVVGVDSIQLSLHTRAVGVGFSSGLVQTLRLLALVLDVLLFG